VLDGGIAFVILCRGWKRISYIVIIYALRVTSWIAPDQLRAMSPGERIVDIRRPSPAFTLGDSGQEIQDRRNGDSGQTKLPHVIKRCREVQGTGASGVISSRISCPESPSLARALIALYPSHQ